MSRWLDLAAAWEENSESVPDNLTKGDKSPLKVVNTPPKGEGTPFCQVLSGCQVGISEKNAEPDESPRTAPQKQVSAPPAQSRESQQSQPQAVPFGTDTGQPKPSAPAPSRDADTPPLTDTGRVKTWTGKIVSLDDWRNMSDWERHGSTGKLWNGITRQWEPMNGGAA